LHHKKQRPQALFSKSYQKVSCWRLIDSNFKAKARQSAYE